MLVLGVALANELVILEEAGPPLDETDDAKRNLNHAKCVACYACVGEAGRSRLDNMNRRFAMLRNEDENDEESEDSDSDAEPAEPEEGEEARLEKEVSTAPLCELWHKACPGDDDVEPLHVLGVGVGRRRGTRRLPRRALRPRDARPP